MAIDFPASPSVDDTFTASGITFTWDGTVWAASGSAAFLVVGEGIDALGDVDTSTVAPTDGQSLVWDNANSQWEPGTVNGTTDLSYTSSTRVLASSTGTNATLPEVVASGDSGLITGADKTKLDGIAAGAQVNVDTDLSYTQSTNLLASSTGTNVTLPVAGAATNQDGLMSHEDKAKLDGIAAGAEVNVDTNLTYTSSTRVLASSTGTNATLPEVIADGDSGLMTGADKTKLDGIAAGAEVNVQSDWNAISGDALIQNKPTLGTAAAANTTDFATSAQGALADSALQSVELNDVTDVTITPTPTNGQALVYNSTTSVWEPGEPAGSISDGDKGDIVVGSSGTTFTVEAFSQNINNTATGYIAMPVGTTAQRPGTPANGQQRYNSDLGAMEVYVQGTWQVIANTSVDYGLITNSSTTTFDYGALF